MLIMYADHKHNFAFTLDDEIVAGHFGEAKPLSYKGHKIEQLDIYINEVKPYYGGIGLVEISLRFANFSPRTFQLKMDEIDLLLKLGKMRVNDRNKVDKRRLVVKAVN